MKTSTQFLTLSVLGLLAATGFARPAFADHDHDHLHDASHAAAEIASHARHVQFEIRSGALTFADRRELSQDAAQLELSARRLQAYASIGDFSRAQLEVITARDLARHLSQHARNTSLGYEHGFRAELSEIFQGLNEVDSELADERAHYRPIHSRPLGGLRPRIVYSFAP